MSENAPAPGTEAEVPAFSPEAIVQELGSKLFVQGDQIMIRGWEPAWLALELRDPAKYAAVHAHLSEVARVEAEAAAEEARRSAEDDWAAQLQYGGGRVFWHDELAKIKSEVERRAATAPKNGKKR